MKRKLLLLILMFLALKNSYGQVSLYVGVLKVNDIKSVASKNQPIEYNAEGPVLNGELTFENKTDSTINLFLSKSETILRFNYKNRTYTTSYLIEFTDELNIFPNSSKSIYFTCSVLYGTTLIRTISDKQENNHDYTKEMLEILPTICVEYKDLNFKLKTTDIRNVEIIWD